jgi:hypothetical protein
MMIANQKNDIFVILRQHLYTLTRGSGLYWNTNAIWFRYSDSQNKLFLLGLLLVGCPYLVHLLQEDWCNPDHMESTGLIGTVQYRHPIN